MRRIILAIAAACVAAQAWAAPAARLIENPEWTSQPSPEDLLLYYPDRAVGKHVHAKVTLRCGVTAEGGLSACRVVAENPKGMDFGKDALRLAWRYRMKPLGEGATVLVDIVFPEPDIDTAPVVTSGPSVPALAAVWPTAAHGEEGFADLACTVTLTGALRDCSAIHEEPEDKGFGAAALLISPALKFRPATRGGKPVEWRYLQRIRWQPAYGSFGTSFRILNDVLWEKAPSTSDVAASYPKEALAKGQKGRVVMRCGLAEDGRLKRCEVVSDEPSRVFEKAAKSLIPLFQARPLSQADSRLVGEIRVSVAFDFVPPDPQPRYLTKLRWTRQLDPDAMLAAFPAKAADAGVETGRATLDCGVLKGGALGDCRVAREEPEGMEFGATALVIAQAFAINPWTDDGLPVDGARVTFSVRFVHKEPEAPPAKP